MNTILPPLPYMLSWSWCLRTNPALPSIFNDKTQLCIISPRPHTPSCRHNYNFSLCSYFLVTAHCFSFCTFRSSLFTLLKTFQFHVLCLHKHSHFTWLSKCVWSVVAVSWPRAKIGVGLAKKIPIYGYSHLILSFGALYSHHLQWDSM